MINRILKLPFSKKSLFLFGPRQTGKTTLVKNLLSQYDHQVIDLLKHDVFFKYKSDPSLLRRELEYTLEGKRKFYVFIDEIQKCPELLDEVHSLIEQHSPKLKFILTGSSARKLKKASTNMLGGRAWRFFLFPLTHIEFGKQFNLDKILHKGSLPPIVNESTKDAFRTLKAYVEVYLKEEILDEAIVRNIGVFSRFLEIAADQSGGIVNYSTISRETGVSSKTIKNYYEILEDTLIIIKLEPYLKSARKRLIAHPKYYLFDTGVINTIIGKTSKGPQRGTSYYGTLFEHFIILEVHRLLNYAEISAKCYYWRSSHGAEVDLIVELEDKLLAIEIKSSPNVKPANLKGLRSFVTDHQKAIPICVSTCNIPYKAREISVIPWQMLFDSKYLDIDI
jgi:uncharacterized protein